MQTTTINEFVSEQAQRLQELKQQIHRLQRSLIPASQTTYIYTTTDKSKTQLKFYGNESKNPVQFLKQCERNMEAVNDNLSKDDKTNRVVRQLKGTAAEWFTTVQDKINVYK